METVLGAEPPERMRRSTRGVATEYSLGALEAEMIEQPDKKHLRYAAEVGRVLHTFNVGDFYELQGDT